MGAAVRFVQNLHPGLWGYLSSVHWGASSPSCPDTEVPSFFRSEEKGWRVLWRREQASCGHASSGAGKEVMGPMGLSSSPALTRFPPCAHMPWGQGVGWGRPGTPAPTPGTSPGWKLPEPWCPTSSASSHQQPGFCSLTVGSPCLPALLQTTSPP